MSLALFKIIAAAVILVITLLGGIWPFIKKGYRSNLTHEQLDLPMSESFASGVFLGAGLLHMLPDAASAFTHAGYHYPFAFLITAVVFLLLLLLEHISVALKKRAGGLLASIVLLTALMLSIHSLLEGAAVGISTSLAATVIIFIAIIAHKGAASFALSANLNKSDLGFWARVIAFAIFALMTPLGIFAGDWIARGTQHNRLLAPIFGALAAGTFLYIGTLHGLDRASLIKRCCDMKEFFSMLLGFAVMAVVAIWT